MFKDQILSNLAERANIAQFVSFSPEGTQRHSRVSGYDANHEFKSILEAATVMIESSPEKSVNVRSFEPDSPKSKEFIYGLKDPVEVVAHIKRLGNDGLYTIINETVDVNDGGVSGVVIGNIIEFAPGDTPRCVEKPGTLQMDVAYANRLFDIVYGIKTPFEKLGLNNRIEFSLHPIPRGVYSEHTIIWEIEDVGYHPVAPQTRWPNKFSQLMGDKAFGLLMAHIKGLPVPKTTVVGRSIAPFTFGEETGTNEYWIRTSPRIQMPGKFSTFRGWRDPFKIMNEEDPTGEYIASILSMAGVRSAWSGATITQANGEPLIEGKSGYGDNFMLGQEIGEVPEDIKSEVLRLYEKAKSIMGDIRMEWCYDSREVWVVQFHCGRTSTQGNIIVPSKSAETKWIDFSVEQGLEKLRELIASIQDEKTGIKIIGKVGLTSHIGDVLRKAQIPSYISLSE
jgi:hypothetical protein